MADSLDPPRRKRIEDAMQTVIDSAIEVACSRSMGEHRERRATRHLEAAKSHLHSVVEEAVGQLERHRQRSVADAVDRLEAHYQCMLDSVAARTTSTLPHVPPGGEAGNA